MKFDVDIKNNENMLSNGEIFKILRKKYTLLVYLSIIWLIYKLPTLWFKNWQFAHLYSFPFNSVTHPWADVENKNKIITKQNKNQSPLSFSHAISSPYQNNPYESVLSPSLTQAPHLIGMTHNILTRLWERSNFSTNPTMPCFSPTIYNNPKSRKI